MNEKVLSRKVKMVELDLRTMEHSHRHEQIFQKLEALKSGEILRITNDHDPKPLHYLLDAEYKGQFAWAYELNGPKDWIVTIKRV
jgi:uncharacterized protein (DUF2249 family)